uniref:Uncharacterized protein n=1 Tax=uncultured Desulfobacterium sp. TaxID=201089 RepID=E1YBH3_9BACT|nr:unknown protein [uncultured Desulfobacterium sp.]
MQSSLGGRKSYEYFTYLHNRYVKSVIFGIGNIYFDLIFLS